MAEALMSSFHVIYTFPPYTENTLVYRKEKVQGRICQKEHPGLQNTGNLNYVHVGTDSTLVLLASHTL